jgi:hypothetical protein
MDRLRVVGGNCVSMYIYVLCIMLPPCPCTYIVLSSAPMKPGASQAAVTLCHHVGIMFMSMSMRCVALGRTLLSASCPLFLPPGRPFPAASPLRVHLPPSVNRACTSRRTGACVSPAGRAGLQSRGRVPPPDSTHMLVGSGAGVEEGAGARRRGSRAHRQVELPPSLLLHRDRC